MQSFQWNQINCICRNFLLWTMLRQNIIRAFLFVVFFSIGAATLSLSILCEELRSYYENLRIEAAERAKIQRWESLDRDYDVLLEQFEKDPNFVRRIAPAALGAEPADSNAVYPEVRAEQLAAARKVLAEESGEQSAGPAVPEWLSRVNQPRRRTILFFAGAVLILISFVCFGPTKQPHKK